MVWAFFVPGSEKERFCFMENEELLTVREVARRLRVDDTTVRRWIKAGTLEAVSLPHSGKRQAYRIKRETVEKLLNSTLPE
jgi:excisionase family DNA binding protein